MMGGGTGSTAPSGCDTGYTLLGATSSGGLNPGWAYKIVTSAGTTNGTFTGSPTAVVDAGIVGFKNQ